MHLLLALALHTAPAPVPHACEELWRKIAAVAGADRASVAEQPALIRKCRAAGQPALDCPAAATEVCRAQVPAIPDGGRALEPAACFWSEVNACLQTARVRAAAGNGAIVALFNQVATDAIVARGHFKLKPSEAELSVGGEVLVGHHGRSWLLLAITRREGERVEGLLFPALDHDRPKEGAIEIALIPVTSIIGGLQFRTAGSGKMLWDIP